MCSQNLFPKLSRSILQQCIKTRCLFANYGNYRRHETDRSVPFLNIKRQFSAKNMLTDMTPKELAIKERIFKQFDTKNKESFLKILETVNAKGGMKRGHVEFIYAALRCMEEYNVQYDIEVYKKLMDLFPKGKMIPKNMIQSEFEHFPRHQDCAVELLDQMEWAGVYPDREMKEIILNVFGKSTHVFKKYARMMYWMLKLKNKNPYLPPEPLPSDIEELARLALKKMSIDPRTKISNFNAKDLEDSLDKTWIVSAQSPVQQKLLRDHNVDKPLYVDGAHLVWLRRLSLSYFILKGDPIIQPPPVEVDEDDVSNLSLHMFGEPKPPELMVVPNTVHEQEDATIFGICATGTSSKDSVLSWIRYLKETNPVLDKIPILFKLKSPPTALTIVNSPFQKPETSSETLDDLSDDIKLAKKVETQ